MQAKMRLVAAAAVADAALHLGLYFGCASDDDTFSDGVTLSSNIVDLTVLACARAVVQVVCVLGANHARRTWFSRRAFRRRILAPRVTAHVFNLGCSSYALVKGLARVVEDGGDGAWRLFAGVVVASIVFPLVTLWLLRTVFSQYNDDCQAARKLLRKDSRDTTSSAAPLLSTHNHRVHKQSVLASPSLYTSTSTVSDHESDDDSSSDDDDGDDPSKSSATEKLRTAERFRRIRERRRKKKEDKEQKLSTGASVRELLRFAAPDWPYLLFGFVCLVVAAISGAFIPKYTGEVINHVSGAHPDRDAFKTSVLRLTAAAIICGVFSGLRGATFTVTMAKMNVRLRTSLYRVLLNQEQAFFDATKLGDLSSRLNSSTTTVSDQIALNVNVFLRSIVEGGIVLVLMFRLSWRLSLLSFAAIPIMTWISKVYGEYYRKLANLTSDALADTSGLAEEALGAVATVRDFGARRAEQRVFAEELKWFYDLNVIEATVYCGYAFTWTAIPALVTALTLYEGGKLVLDRPAGEKCGEGSMCSGDLVSFMLYSQSLSSSVASIGTIFTGIAQALGAADKVFDLMKRQPKVAGGGAAEDEGSDPAPFLGTVELRHVSFRYPSRPTQPVLEDFSLKVDQGQVVALVGESGGGKSSVCKLLLHHYDALGGQVLVSGVPIASISQQALRRNLSVVQQEPTLFGRSVLRNILYGLEGTADEPSMDQVIRAAKLAHAHEFIVKLPKGYATLLGQRGSTLSGGQRQRLCIARAVVRRPKILLLDEATSALDAESEAKVVEALDDVIRQEALTVLVVAQCVVVVVLH